MLHGKWQDCLFCQVTEKQPCLRLQKYGHINESALKVIIGVRKRKRKIEGERDREGEIESKPDTWTFGVGQGGICTTLEQKGIKIKIN